MDEGFLDVEGRRLRYLTGGTGPPLVLMHGFLGSAENFETWFEELATRRTLVIPDLPGFGASSPLRERHTSAAIAAAVEPLVDHLGLERFDLGGLCLGSPVACALARRRPGRVGRLLLHTPLLAPELVRRRFHLQVAAMTAPGLFDGVIWLSRRRVVSDLYKRLMVEGKDVDRRAAEVNFANQCRAHPRASREWLRDGLRVHDAGLVAAHPEPVLLIAAAGDRIVDSEGLRRLTAGWERCRLALVEDAGHGWNEAYVRRQLELLGAFLDGRPLPAGSDAGAAA
jgi:pimeloyl-ACP methyl ester carboxylesterase